MIIDSLPFLSFLKIINNKFQHNSEYLENQSTIGLC
jgi:hypothetical protein